MAEESADEIARMFAAAIRRDPTRPLLTWYDDATGERTELSGATLDNWVEKTANLLVDGAGLGDGDRAGVLLPPHWQTAAVLLGCWAAGVEVTTTPGPVDVLFATEARVAEADDWSAGDRYALSLHPLALPMREVPSGWQDYTVAVRAYGDVFAAYPRGSSEWSRKDPFGLQPGDRVLIDAATHPEPRDWLLAPLAAGASIVLCGNLDRAKLAGRIASEQVTRDLS
ncbi:TIGR03089 family protein [Asanoa ishikariensis]|uniref:TIGR03089 family protein n=1 Tax=Asanoa ishikariensis TaxID=137265 RepID=A0A1H3MC35_9ACTN|nr:TIGR03089 family protein [Asanoa ishikariensis]GIF66041.1 TIGR03089 family protein [Asanoa ishikariensis]SDY74251.1 TIGR03089 family protein [Asanoa ishikariensis]